MPDTDKKPVDGGEAPEEASGIFGDTTEKPEGGKEEAKEEKKFDSIPEDHPTIVALRGEIDKVKEDKGTMGENLSKTNSIIKMLEGKIEVLMKGSGNKEDNEEVLFKDIKWSKDLSEEEREEMTDTEIKQMDVLADIQTKQNEQYTKQVEKENKASEESKENEAGKVDNANKTVQEQAKELSKGEDGKERTEVANQIIESFKLLKFDVDGLSEEDIKKRVEMAAREVPDYKAPKEQSNKSGKANKKGKGGGDEEFNSDKIIEEANKENDGNYQL